MVGDIAKLLSSNEKNIKWRYTGPFDETKQVVRMDNLLHLAARTGDVERFLSIFKKSVEHDVRLLEYNKEVHENPFHIAAEMGILPDVVKGIFEHLDSEKVTKEKSESVKSYVRNALGDRCALNNSKRTPLDVVSKEVKKEVREIAGIKESLICNKKFRLCLYIVGAIACVAALCLSLYFLYLCSQGLALASMATIASGGFGYLGGKVYSEIYDLNSVSTLAESLGDDKLAKMTAGA
ncbi:MAG: hypothetical protein ACR5K9_04135 [Wolbachia sp.]